MNHKSSIINHNSEEAPGTPAWMVTFSDCMNLLLTFFVLLVTFSSFSNDPRQALLIVGAAISTSFGKMPEPTADSGGQQDTSSLLAQHQIQLAVQPEYGSDKPTRDQAQPDEAGVLQEDVQTADYHRYKLFRIASRKVFLGRGVVLSAEGRYLLAVMAAFLKEVPGQIVLSENGSDGQDTDPETGLARACAMLEFFKRQDLDPQRFSISAGAMMPQAEAQDQTGRGTGDERRLEIVLLDRGGPP
jgi:flagellar motor protein MotB